MAQAVAKSREARSEHQFRKERQYQTKIIRNQWRFFSHLFYILFYGKSLRLDLMLAVFWLIPM